MWRAPIWVPRSPKGLTRVLHLMSFAATSFPLMLCQIGWRPDVVLTVAPAFMCAPAGLLTARICRAKAWLHIQDFEVDVAFGMGLLRGRLLQRLVLRAESFLLKRFDTVSTISSRMIERLLLKGVLPAQTRYFPNWVDLTRADRVQPGNLRSTLGIATEATVLLFSGTLGAKQGLLAIPEVAKLLGARTDLVFVICGEGVMKAALETAATDLPNVRILPLQPAGRVGELLAMADIHLLPQSPDAADLVLPSKLSGMLASGRPVIGTCRAGTELSEIIAQCGIVVEPENVAELAGAILSLADDAALRRAFGIKARAFAESHFERDAVLSAAFASQQDVPETPIGDLTDHTAV